MSFPASDPGPRRNRRGVLIGGLAAVGGLAGCAGEMRSTWKAIHRSGRLRMGVANGEPWFRHDPLTGAWRGIGHAVGVRLARDLGVRLEPVETSWMNAVAGLQSNQYDIMPVLDPSPARQKAIDFPAAPMFQYAMGALADPALQARTWAALNRPDLRIGVAMGTAGEPFATRWTPKADISRFASVDETAAAFAARRIDAVIFYYPALVAQYAKLRVGRLVLPSPVAPVVTSAGIRRDGDPRWSEWLSGRFAQYRADGVMRGLFRDYAAQFTANSAAADRLAAEMMAEPAEA